MINLLLRILFELRLSGNWLFEFFSILRVVALIWCQRFELGDTGEKLLLLSLKFSDLGIMLAGRVANRRLIGLTQVVQALEESSVLIAKLAVLALLGAQERLSLLNGLFFLGKGLLVRVL